MEIYFENDLHRDLYTRVCRSSKNHDKLWAGFVRHYPSFAKFETLWLKSRQSGCDPLALELPWINFLALDWLDRNLRKSHRVFEWGMGGSTLFFTKRCKRVVSVEHDRKWFDKASSSILAISQGGAFPGVRSFLFGVNKPQLLLAEPKVVNVQSDQYRPIMSGARGLYNMDFRAYVDTITSFPREYFDCILIDGRARMDCLERALPYLRTGGCMVLDNSDYLRYRSDLLVFEAKYGSALDALHFLSPGPCSSVIGWKTSVYRKSNPTH